MADATDMAWTEPGMWQWRCEYYGRGPRPPRRRPDDMKPVEVQAREVARLAMDELFNGSASEITDATVDVKDPNENVTKWDCVVESTPVFLATLHRAPKV